MGIGCQRNGYWAATNHLSGRGFVQPIKELSSAAGLCAGRGCALIRQLANIMISFHKYSKSQQRIAMQRAEETTPKLGAFLKFLTTRITAHDCRSEQAMG